MFMHQTLKILVTKVSAKLDYGPSFSKLKDDRVTVEYF